MIRRVLALAVFLVLSIFAGAQKPEGKPSEKSAEKPDYSQESFVVEQVRTSYRFEDDGTGRKELFARVKVQSEAGVGQWGQVVVGYNSANERIEIPYVRVHKSDGGTITAPPDAVQDLSAPIERDARQDGLRHENRLRGEADSGISRKDSESEPAPVVRAG